MSVSNTGDVGFCYFVDRTSSLIRTWDEHRTVISVDCNYKTCGYANSCEMYQRGPVGYQFIPSKSCDSN